MYDKYLVKNASSSNSNTIEKSGLKRVTGLLFTIKQYKTTTEMSNKLNPMQFLFSFKKSQKIGQNICAQRNLLL